MEVYLDHNATTPLRPEVEEAMAACGESGQSLRNPSSVHLPGRLARRCLRGARETVAGALGSTPEEVVFTGGGSEAINLALKGVVFGHLAERPHLITTQVEHPAVLRACAWLEHLGVEVTYLPVDEWCRVDPAKAIAALTDRTVLVSIIHANNEVGTIQSVAEIGAAARDRGVLMHLDAVQSFGKIALDVNDLNCDLLSVSAHKLYGPKGVGALYVRQGTSLTPLVHGGGQESGRRGGTENVPGAAGFAKAVELGLAEMPEVTARCRALRTILEGIAQELPAVRVNSPAAGALAHTLSMSFMYIDGMALTLNLSMKGVYVSVGSACHSHELTPSHVLKAMGLTDEAAFGAIRFSLGRGNDETQVRYAVEQTVDIVRKLRLVTMPEDIGKCTDNCPCFIQA
jgi:cysteine desulfurase